MPINSLRKTLKELLENKETLINANKISQSLIIQTEDRIKTNNIAIEFADKRISDIEKALKGLGK